MDLSDEIKEADQWLDEVAARQAARAQTFDRESEAFADDRAAELDQER